jgi:NADH-quinone oxidoreductase subunit E
MSKADSSEKTLDQLMSKERMHDIDQWINKYPADQRQSAVMSTLRIVQEEHGYLNQELMDLVGAYLNMPAIAVYEVASFYTMYEHKPVGRHQLNVCTNISCMLRDSAVVLDHLEKKLGITVNETTEDGRFTLRAVECLGACAGAPMMQVDKAYHEHLTPESIDRILEQYE